MIVEGAASKVGLPITRDPGRVLRPGDPGFPGTPEKPKTRACVQCQREFTRTSNAQKRCPACAAKVKPPAGKAAAEPAAAKARTTAMRRAPKPRAPAVGGGRSAHARRRLQGHARRSDPQARRAQRWHRGPRTRHG